MRQKSFKIIFFLCMTILMGSCIEENFHNFPRKIVFENAGGEQIFTGTKGISHIAILEDGYDKDYSPVGEGIDTLIASYGWLTVKAKGWDDKLYVEAKPSNKGKRQKLEIHLSFGDDHCFIECILRPSDKK